MLSDLTEQFRVRLSAMLRAALVERNEQATRTLRCIMAAIDNASALSQEEQAPYLAAAITEAPRRHLSEQALAAILQAEIDARSKSAAAYEGRGNADQAALLQEEIALVEALKLLLASVSAASAKG